MAQEEKKQKHGKKSLKITKKNETCLVSETKKTKEVFVFEYSRAKSRHEFLRKFCE